MRFQKYHNTITEYDGIKFHSKKECYRYKELKLLERAGEIMELSLQPKFCLLEPLKGVHRGIYYLADFKYLDRQFNAVVVEDCKGYKTKDYEMKKKMFQSKFPQLIFLET